MMLSTPPHESPDDCPGPLLSCRELALRWRLSTKSIHHLVKSGKVRAMRLGCTLRFRPEDVLAAEARAATCEPGEGKPASTSTHEDHE